MPGLLKNIIIAAIPDVTDYTVALTWENGETTVAEFRQLASKGVFKSLLAPDLFARVHTSHNGRVLAWSDELELDADSLWFEVHPEDNPFADRLSSRLGGEDIAHP